LTKNGLGNNLGDFFTNSSGHPVLKGSFTKVQKENKLGKKLFCCIFDDFAKKLDSKCSDCSAGLFNAIKKHRFGNMGEKLV
jgi:hypothetical protein